MSTKVETLIAVFNAKLDGFRKGITQALDATGALKDKSAKAFEGINDAAVKSAKGILGTFSAVENTITRVGVALGRSMATTALAAAKMGIEFNRTKDIALLSFTAMLGSGEKALRFFKQLEAFQRTTPFEMEGLLKASQRLLAARMAAEKVIPALKSVGDAIALAGGGSAELDRAVVALSQIAATQKMGFAEMDELAKAGIFAWEALAKVMGTDVPTAMLLTQQQGGEVFKYFEQFLAEIGKNSEGAMARLANMLPALVSNAWSSIKKTAGEIFEPFYREAENFLTWALGPTGFKMDGITGQLKESVRQISQDVFLWLQMNGQSAITRIGEAFIIFSNAVRNGVAYLREHGNVIGIVIRAMADWALAIGRWLAEHPRVLAALIAMKAAFMTGIPQAIGSTILNVVKLAYELVQLHLLLKQAFGTGLVTMLVNAGKAVLDLATKLEVVKRIAVFLQGIQLFSGWGGAAVSAAKKLGALVGVLLNVKTLLVIIAGYAGFQFGVWLRQFVYGRDDIAELNKELAKSADLTERLLVLRARMTGSEIALAEATTDPDKRIERLEQGRDRTQKNIDGQEARIKAETDKTQKAELEKRLAHEKAMLEDWEKALQRARDNKAAIEQEKADAKAEGRDGTATTASATGITPAEPEKKLLTPEERRQATEDRIGDLNAEKADPMLKGFADLMKRVDEGASIDDIAAAIREMPGMTAEIAEQIVGRIDEERKVKEEKEAVFKEQAARRKKEIDEAEKKGKDAGGMSKEEAEAARKDLDRQLAGQLRPVASAVRDGIAASVKKGIAEANKTAQTEDRTKATEFDPADALRKADETLPLQKAAEFTDALNALRQAFIRGEIAQREYTLGLEKIQQQIQEASQAQDAKKDADADVKEASGGKISPEYQSRLDALKKQLDEDAISLEEFRKGVQGITGAVRTQQEADKSMNALRRDGGIDSILEKKYGTLQKQLQTQAISPEAFQEGVRLLEQQIRAAQGAGDTFRRIMEGTFGQTFGEGSEAARQLQREMSRLKLGMEKGTLGVDEFNTKMQQLESQASEAAEAEKQRRLIKGDFQGAGLDPKKALQERMASIQMGRWNQAIDDMANRLMGVGEKAQDFGDKVSQAGESAQSLSENMPGSREVSEFWQRLTQFIQTIDGQRALILNQLALLRQSMQITKDALSQRELQAKIDDLIRALQVLDQQEAALPTFIGDRGELEFKDPGLSKDGGGGGRRGVFGPDGNGGGGGISLSFPNLTRITQTEASLLADAVVRETSRRGRALSR